MLQVASFGFLIPKLLQSGTNDISSSIMIHLVSKVKKNGKEKLQKDKIYFHLYFRFWKDPLKVRTMRIKYGVGRPIDVDLAFIQVHEPVKKNYLYIYIDILFF